jgi:hypothetical protein
MNVNWSCHSVISRIRLFGIGLVILSMGLPSWVDSASASNADEMTMDIVDHILLAAKQKLKPGMKVAEIEAFFRNAGYSFKYFKAGENELQINEDYRKAGLDFVGRYTAVSPDLKIIAEGLGSTTSIVHITCYMGRAGQLLHVDIESRTTVVETFPQVP